MKGLCDNEMKLEFASKTCNEAFARIAVAAFVSQLDPTIDELSDIKTAFIFKSIPFAFENKHLKSLSAFIKLFPFIVIIYFPS